MLENKDISLVHSMISLGSCTMKLTSTTEMMVCPRVTYVSCISYYVQVFVRLLLYFVAVSHTVKLQLYIL